MIGGHRYDRDRLPDLRAVGVPSMGVVTMSRSTWGLDHDRADDWRTRAACLDDMRFTEGPFGNSTRARDLAAVLAHKCMAHCPVIQQCDAEARRERPFGVVQAGRMYGDWPHRQPYRLRHTACTDECDGLPWVWGVGRRDRP